MSSDWSPEFEQLLRTHLPDLEAEAPLPADEPLVSLGLDSVHMVGLMVDIEDSIAVAIPEELMTAGTFYRGRTLWLVVEQCRTAERSVSAAPPRPSRSPIADRVPPR